MNEHALFRGRDPETHIWYFGSYLVHDERSFCFSEEAAAHPENTKHLIAFDQITDWGLPNRFMQADVDPATVGQFVRMRDKHKKRIFEGDIVRVHDTLPGISDEWRDFTGVVEYRDNAFVIVSDPFTHYRWIDYEIEVIGNIHDNPDLLEGGTT